MIWKVLTVVFGVGFVGAVGAFVWLAKGIQDGIGRAFGYK